jgi:hypothetical protein
MRTVAPLAILFTFGVTVKIFPVMSTLKMDVAAIVLPAAMLCLHIVEMSTVAPVLIILRENVMIMEKVVCVIS